MTTLRDPRIDVFRGIALIMIFVDHLLDNMWQPFTLQNFGISDAAEGFVLLSGMSAGLAYGNYFRAPARIWVGLGRVWGRAWTIYLVHILVTMAGLAVAAGLSLQFRNAGLWHIDQFDTVLAQPVQFYGRLLLLTFHLDYADILPLYIGLLVMAPIGLWLAWRAPLLLLAGSAAFWLVVNIFGLNLPSYTRDFGWYFNPLAWQLIFTFGILTGVALKDGRRFVPVRLWLQILTGAFLLFCLVWYQTAFGDRVWGWLWQAEQAGWPFYLISVEKTFLPLPRLLHALALAYFLSSFAFVKQATASRIAAPFALLGRQALPVFATGTVLTFLLHGIRTKTGVDPVLDSLMLAGGIAAMLAIAAARDYWPKAGTGGTAP